MCVTCYPKTTTVTVFSMHEHGPSEEGLVLPVVEQREGSPMARCQSPQPPPDRTGLCPRLGTGGGTRMPLG